MNELVFEHGGQLDWNVFFDTLFRLIAPLLPLITVIIIIGVLLWVLNFILSVCPGGKNEMRGENRP